MNEYFLLIFLPVVAGILLFIVPDRLKPVKGIFTVLVTAVTLILAIIVYSYKSSKFGPGNLLPGFLLPSTLNPSIESFFTFQSDALARLIVLFISLFGFLIAVYSLAYEKYYQPCKIGRAHV